MLQNCWETCVCKWKKSKFTKKVVYLWKNCIKVDNPWNNRTLRANFTSTTIILGVSHLNDTSLTLILYSTWRLDIEQKTALIHNSKNSNNKALLGCKKERNILQTWLNITQKFWLRIVLFCFSISKKMSNGILFKYMATLKLSMADETFPLTSRGQQK